MYDMIIIGGGFAGYTAAIYALRYKLKTLLIASEVGGAIVKAHEVENYPGFKSISGIDLMEKFEEHAKSFGLEQEIDEVLGIEKKGNTFILKTRRDKEYTAKTVILATGSARQKLDVPGAKEFEGKGLHYCATCDAPFYKNKTVAIIGGSNSAASAAQLLTRFAKKVYIIYRKEELRCEPIVKECILDDPKIEMVYNTNVIGIHGTKFVDKVLLDREHNGKKEIALDGVFVEIGQVPSSFIAKMLGVELNERGEIIVNAQCETNVKGIYAAGDVTNVVLRQGIVAASQGAIAATFAYKQIAGKKAEKTEMSW